MPIGANGLFTRLYNWAADSAAGTVISSAKMDAEHNGFKDAINYLIQSPKFKGQIKAIVGSESAPAFAFASDTDTGFFLKSPGVLALSLNGVEVAEFSVNGLKYNNTSPGIIGETRTFAGLTLPSGWLHCQGGAISRATYADLYAAIGDTYGAGDGSTTFNLPDYSGRVLLGTGGSYSLAATGGAETHTLAQAELPAVSLSVSGSTNTAGAHTHSQIYKPTKSVGRDGGSSGTQDYNGYASTKTGSAGAHSHTLTGSTSNLGSGQAHNNMQPYAASHFMIYSGVA